jgi:hypothetical protein
MPITPGRTGQSSVITVNKVTGHAPKVALAPGSAGVVSPTPTVGLIESLPKLSRYLVDLEARVSTLAAQTRQAIFASGNNVRGIAITASQTYYINHQLGRAFVGVIITRLRLSSASNNYPLSEVISPPSNKSTSTYFSFTANVSGTIDLYFY